MADVESSPSDRHLRCVVVTPEATVLDEQASFVALPLYDGEIGIAPLHSPLIGRMGYGEMRVVRPGGVDRFYVDGGFVQVVGNTVSVLTNRAVPATAVNREAAEEHLKQAFKKPAHTDELRMIRDREIMQSRAQIRVANRVQR